MDTREKVISLKQAAALLQNGRWSVIGGLFDPLTALQARRIESQVNEGEQVLIVVQESPNTLLPAEMRCQLMAALRSVRYVVKANRSDWLSLTENSRNLHIVDDEEAEKLRSKDFCEMVASRQGF